jgi:hypothetical protein
MARRSCGRELVRAVGLYIVHGGQASQRRTMLLAVQPAAVELPSSTGLDGGSTSSDSCCGSTDSARREATLLSPFSPRRAHAACVSGAPAHIVRTRERPPARRPGTTRGTCSSLETSLKVKLVRETRNHGTLSCYPNVYDGTPHMRGVSSDEHVMYPALLAAPHARLVDLTTRELRASTLPVDRSELTVNIVCSSVHMASRTQTRGRMPRGGDT